MHSFCHSFSNLLILFIRYYVEFSKPSKDKPIPEGVVNVFFDIILGDGDDYEIEFSFESESLKHKLGKTEKDNKTMRDNMLQVSIQCLTVFKDSRLPLEM